MDELKSIEEKFVSDRVYNLYSIGLKLGVSRDTIHRWIREGVIKNVTKGDQVYKVKVKLKAELVGGCWKALGANVKAFLRDIQKN